MLNSEILSEHSSVDRLLLSEYLSNLPEVQFQQLVFALQPARGVISSNTAPQGLRTSDLLIWAESLTGPGLAQVWHVLNQLLGRSTPANDTICPYKGLSFFDFNDQDAKYFFGRKKLIKTLVDKVETANFVAIVGASGSGKSSVLRAGLLYQLHQRGEAEIHILVPGKNPLQNIALAFVDKNLPRLQQAELQGKAEEQIRQGADGLRRLVQNSPESKVVLVVDQFEESFTLCKEESQRQAFFATLLGALEQLPGKFCLILAMRSDFLGKCYEQNYSGLAKQVQNSQVVVLPLEQNELIEAIIKPAQQVGLIVEPELVKQLLFDVEKSPGSLPLLQYALKELWKHRQSNKLTLNTYVDLGGVTGTLEKRADSFYKQLDASSRSTVEFIFLSLTQQGDHTEPTRRQVSKRDLISSDYDEAVIDLVIKQLADANLIVTESLALAASSTNLDDKSLEHLNREKNFGKIDEEPVFYKEEIIINVAHEALIRHWPRLQNWLAKNEDQLRSKQIIESSTDLWLEHDKNPAYLLRSNKLSLAQDFLNHQTGNQASVVILKLEAQDFVRRSIRRHQFRQWLERATVGAAVTALLFSAASATVLWMINRSNLSRKFAERSGVIFNFQQIDGLINAIQAGKLQQDLSPILYLTRGLPGTLAFKDSTTQVIASLRHSVYDLRQVNVLQGHASPVEAVTTSPDGEIFASADDDGLIKFWQVNGIPIKTIQAHTQRIKSLAFSPDARYLVSASEDGTVKVWTSQGDYVRTLLGHSDVVSKAIFSLDGQTIISASYDGLIKFWSVSDGRLTRLLQANQGPLHTLAVSTDGNQLASAGKSGTVKIWNAQQSSPIRTFYSESCNDKDCDVFGLSFSSNPGYLATAGANGKIHLWTTDGSYVREIGYHGDRVLDIKFLSPKNKEASNHWDVLATSSRDKTVGLWFFESPNISEKLFLNGHNSNVNSVSFSPDGGRLISVSRDMEVRIWSATKATVHPITEIWHDGAKHIRNSFSSHGLDSKKQKKLVIADDTGRIRIWHNISEKWQEEMKIEPENAHNAGIWDLSFTPDGSSFATAGLDGTVRFWSADKGEAIAPPLKAHEKEIRDISFSQDGSFATASEDGKVKIWTPDKMLIHTIEINQSGAFRVAISPDGKKLATKINGETIQFWHRRNNQWVKVNDGVKSHASEIMILSFSPDSKRLASGSEDGVIKIWKAGGKLVQDLYGHIETVNDIAFSPDSNLLASVSSNGNIIIWNRLGSKLFEFPGYHFSDVTGISFSPDGKQLASSSRDGRTFIWDLDLDNLLDSGCDVLKGYLNIYPEPQLEIREICDNNSIEPASVAEYGTFLAHQGDEVNATRHLQSSIQKGYPLSLDPEELTRLISQYSVSLEEARNAIENSLDNGELSAKNTAIQKFNIFFQLLDSMKLDKDPTFSARAEINRLTALEIARLQQDDKKKIFDLLRANEQAKTLYDDVVMTQAVGQFPHLSNIAWHDSAQKWQELCRSGSTSLGAADQSILDLCDLAVALDATNGSIRDSRAMAKLFLQKDIPAAIADFDAFLAWLGTEPATATYAASKLSEWQSWRQQCRAYLTDLQAQFDAVTASYSDYNPIEQAPDVCRSFDFREGYQSTPVKVNK